MKNALRPLVAFVSLVIALPLLATTNCGGKSDGQPGEPVGARPPVVHREQAATCAGVHSPPEPGPNPSEGSTCTQHADCTEGTNGKCVGSQGAYAGHFYCTYDDCATDADCDSGKVCYCTASTSARCLSIGNCQRDSDCGSNGYCSPSMSFDCNGYHPIDGYHCHTAADTCLDDADCTGNDYCNFDVYAGHWTCMAPMTDCAIG